MEVIRNEKNKAVGVTVFTTSRVEAVYDLHTDTVYFDVVLPEPNGLSRKELKALVKDARQALKVSPRK